MLKKMMTSFLIISFLFPLEGYSRVDKHMFCLATPSVFNGVRIVSQNDNYYIIKISTTHFIYIDTSRAFIEFVRTGEGWQANCGDKRHEFNTRFFDECGVNTSLEEEEKKGYANILGWLLKRGYQIRVKDNRVYLQQPVVPGARREAVTSEVSSSCSGSERVKEEGGEAGTFPENIIIRELKKILDGFESDPEIATEDVEQYRKAVSDVLESCRPMRGEAKKAREQEERDRTAGKKKKTKYYPSEAECISSVRRKMHGLIPRIIIFLCSSNPKEQLLGERLKGKIDFLNVPPNYICGAMLLEFDTAKLLLQKCLVEELIVSALEKREDLDDYTIVVNYETEEQRKAGEFIEETTTWTITLQDNRSKETRAVATCIFSKKSRGVQLGTEMVVEDSMGGKKYYVKTHQAFHMSKSYSGEITKTEIEIKQPPVGEMVVYKMLEKLGLGARIHFVVNPYARSGLFIVSEALPSFEEAATLEKLATGEKKDTSVVRPTVLDIWLDGEKTDSDGKGFETHHTSFKDMLDEEMRTQTQTPTPTPFKMAITQMDLVERIFNLTDFHACNFGVVGRLTSSPEWKILDFIANDDMRKDLATGFIEGNTIFYYREGGILATVLKRRKRSEKIQVGIQAMEDLKAARDFDKHLDETNNEILMYLQTGRDGKTIAELLGMNLQHEKEQLEIYRRYVKDNIERLEQVLATEQAKDILAGLMFERGWRLNIEPGDEINVGIKPPLFEMPDKVLEIMGRLFSLCGGDYIRDIVSKIIEKKIKIDSKIEEEKTSIIIRFIEALDTLERKHARGKAKGLWAMLELMKMDNIITIFQKINRSEVQDIDFIMLKSIVMAA